MKYHLQFELAGLPKMTNTSGSKSTHWRVIKAERDRWLELVHYTVLSKRPAKPLKRARITLTRHSSVSPDPDGLVSGFKPIVDGLVKSGVLENDKMKNIGMPTYRWTQAPKGGGKITVIVEEINEDEVI